ncbi:MAG: hypothetical protein ACLRPV_12185 [Lacrimispora saccharolytica]
MRDWNEIKRSIEGRRERKEITNAIFSITTSKAAYDEEELMSKKAFQKTVGIFEKYLGEDNHIRVDSMDGCWDLNRVWYQFPAIPCGVEYSGVYPLEWEDIQKLTEWIDDGEIWVTVMVWNRKNKKYIPNW